MEDAMKIIKELPEICHRCRNLKPGIPEDERRKIMEEVKKNCPRLKT